MHNPISIREIRSGDLEAVRRINAESSPGVSLLTRHGLERLTAGATLAWVAAAGQDIETCEVNLEPSNPRSLAFHRRCGFIEVGSMKTTDGRRVVLLQKDVKEVS